jgi:hypothetical protein
VSAINQRTLGFPLFRNIAGLADTFQHGGQFLVPGGSVWAGEHFVGVGIIGDFLFGLVPSEFAAGAEGNVGEVTGFGDVVARGNI